MGHHYVPRVYLQGFASDPGKRIWAYDRDLGKSFRTNIVNVAQENKLYSEDLERRFSTELEAPVAPTIAKILNGDAISSEERKMLSQFVIFQWKRTLKGKDRFKSFIPEVSEETRAELKQKLDDLARTNPEYAEKVKGRKREVDEVIDEYKSNPPTDIWHQSLTAETHLRPAKTLFSMHWRFLVAPAGNQFIASDNPVFFFEHMGLGNREAELSMPLSSQIALWANWSQRLPIGYSHATAAMVKELNRRTAKNARRYVFAKHDAPWILPLVQKRFHRLNRIE